MNMHRLAFKMQLLPGCEEEYKKRHDELWPELKKLLKEAGISNYSIFLDATANSLFGVLQTDNVQKVSGLRSHPVMVKWWDYMADIMETNPDNSPLEIPLTEVFHLY